MEQVLKNSSSLRAYFQATPNLLKNIDAHLTTLIQMLWLIAHSFQGRVVSLFSPIKYAMVFQHGPFSLHNMLEGPWAVTTQNGYLNTHDTTFR